MIDNVETCQDKQNIFKFVLQSILYAELKMVGILECKTKLSRLCWNKIFRNLINLRNVTFNQNIDLGFTGLGFMQRLLELKNQI